MNTTLVYTLNNNAQFNDAAKAVAAALKAAATVDQVVVVSQDEAVIKTVVKGWKLQRSEYDDYSVGKRDVNSVECSFFVCHQEDDGEEASALLDNAIKKMAAIVGAPSVVSTATKVPFVVSSEFPVPASKPEIASVPAVNKIMNTNTNQKSNIMKLVGTLFSYGGKQASTGSLICTFIVSDPYYTGQKNPDGGPQVAYETILKASMIVPQTLASSLNWEPFTTKNGKSGTAARVSFYGELSLDRRDQVVKESDFKKTIFWLNPKIAKPSVQTDGSRKWADCSPDDPEAAMMVFPIIKREKSSAPKAAKTEVALPGVKVEEPSAKVTPAAKIKKVLAKPKIVHNVDLAEIPFA